MSFLATLLWIFPMKKQQQQQQQTRKQTKNIDFCFQRYGGFTLQYFILLLT